MTHDSSVEQVHVLIGEAGEYGNYTQWVQGIYTDVEIARTECTRLNKKREKVKYSWEKEYFKLLESQPINKSLPEETRRGQYD